MQTTSFSSFNSSTTPKMLRASNIKANKKALEAVAIAGLLLTFAGVPILGLGLVPVLEIAAPVLHSSAAIANAPAGGAILYYVLTHWGSGPSWGDLVSQFEQLGFTALVAGAAASALDGLGYIDVDEALALICGATLAACVFTVAVGITAY